MSRAWLFAPARAALGVRKLVLGVQWWMHCLINSWRTTTQVVALVVATLAASIVLVTVLHVRTLTLSAYDDRAAFTERLGENIGRLVYDAGGDIHAPQSLARIQYVVEDIGSIGGLTAVFFADRDGLLLAHSDPGLVGSHYRNPDMMQALDTAKMVVAKEPGENGVIELDVAVPVEYYGTVVGGLEAHFSLESLNDEIASAQRDAWLSALMVALALIPVAAVVVARFHRTLEHMAITDGLSGLYDHRYFRQRLGQELTRSARYGHELALVMFDIDSFKSYNDTYGHLAGDEAIQRVAQILRASIRGADIPARYGGEEFAAILPETNDEQAYLVCERIRRSIKASIVVDGKPGALTASFGVACYPVDANSVDALIRSADIALYQAKLSGKNCSRVYSSVVAQSPPTLGVPADH